jgi:phospholipase/carboxylesterase
VIGLRAEARSPKSDLWHPARVNETIDIAGLTTHVIGASDAAATIVLLHGFGAPGDDLVPLAPLIARFAARGGSPPKLRFVFPEAPLELDGMFGGRAWWLLDLAALEQELRVGAPRDRRGEVPEGLPAARAHVGRFVDQLVARYAIDERRLVLGGFSQGAMVALDVALHRATSPAALVVMSGTLIAERDWSPRLPGLAGTPIVMSHGRRDMLLPFAIAEELKTRLADAGARVDWHPFVGGHEIPPAVLDAVGQLAAALT